MKLTLNGQLVECTDDMSLQELIDQTCEHNKRIVAEVNGVVIQSLSWPEMILKEGDKIELVSFVGGG